MALIQRMTKLQARLNAIPARLGVPSFGYLLIRHVELDDDFLSESHTDTLLENIKVTSVPTRYVGLSVGSGGAFRGGEGLTIAQSDFRAVIPRIYSREFLEKNVAFYVITPPVSGGVAIYNPATQEPASGIFCKLAMIDDERDTIWNVVLRQYRDGTDAIASGEIGY